MHLVLGLITGMVLGALAGTAAVQFATPSALTLQANRTPAQTAPAVRYLDI